MPASLFPGPEPDAAPGRSVYTVSRLNKEVRVLLERGLGVVWVEGELSNFSQPSSGHWYFSLKDRESQVRCAMFRLKNAALGFTPKAGQHVIARGRVSLYEPRGEYQLIVDTIEEAGLGALQREFERLKAKLAAEGLFASERKRSLPRFPLRIAVVTSPTGAAVRDVLNILARRFPPAAVLVYPTPVQGAAAAPAIVQALQAASARLDCDVLILARGGGSLEDLWAFNDEGVARAIRACAIPVVTGIGHEIDFTIADFAADARAPTPSGAAELVAPDRVACLEALARMESRMSACMRRELRVVSSRFASVNARLKQAHPGMRLVHQAQRLDDLEQRLAGAAQAVLHTRRHRLNEAFTTLLQHSPERLAREYRRRHEGLDSRLRRAINEYLSRRSHRVDLAQRTLQTASPLATLARGFAIVTRADGSLVTDARSAPAGEEIEARLATGRLRARVTGSQDS
ncbi:MAG: exodeoxyribonuclease VII large subunit [Gammaproteobacteria bacterium]|nr:exodeoxyribonuclease VII large subunit [Gammaproteobacteria bacterium]MDE2263965.1 exodeoxyribonuclease VII large subunit [Gammaproteobacteria bacterium]